MYLILHFFVVAASFLFIPEPNLYTLPVIFNEVDFLLNQHVNYKIISLFKNNLFWIQNQNHHILKLLKMHFF